MKKVLAFFLSLSLLCGALAFAEESTTNTITNKTEQKTADTTVIYEIVENDSYTVTIPSKVTLEDHQGSLSGTLSVKLQTKAFNVSGSQITVKLTKCNFKLVCGTNEIPYTLKASGKEYEQGDSIISWTYGQSTEVSNTLVVQATVSKPLPAGKYTDTLTFTVSIESANEETDTDIDKVPNT